MSLHEEPLNSIVEEIVDLIGAEDFYSILVHRPQSLYLVEGRLLEVFLNRRSLETRQLVTYLRATVKWAADLPTWHVLLRGSIELAHMRGEDVHMLFYGLQPAPAYSSTAPVEIKQQFTPRTQ